MSVVLQDIVDALSDGLYNLIRVRKSRSDFNKTVYPMLKTAFIFNSLSRYDTTVQVGDANYRLEDYQVTKGINDLVLPKVIVVRDAPGYIDFKDHDFFTTIIQFDVEDKETKRTKTIQAEVLSPAEMAVAIKQLGGWMRTNAALIPLHVEELGLITEYVKLAIYDDGLIEERTQPAVVKLAFNIDEFNSENYKEWAFTKAQFLIQDGGNNA